MRIGFIGAGKVSTAFGRHLYAKGLTLSGYCDHHADKVAYAVKHTRSHAFKNIAEVAANSDMILITTRDDQISGVCSELCEQQCIAAAHMVGHMSGAHSSQILEKARALGATVFSLHPLQAFADEKKALADLPNTYFSLEVENNVPDPILKMLTELGNPYFTISSEHKSLYHLSACIFSNYLVTLVAAGLSALKNAGISPQDGFIAMRPLIDGTLENITRMGPSQALTGPIARGDTGTIQTHMDALNTLGLDKLKSIYTTMGIKTLELAMEKILKEPDKAAEIKQILENQ